MVNRQPLLVCHAEPYKNYNVQIDGASQHFGVRLTILVHLLFLVCFFFIQWCVFVCVFLLYRSCPIHDKGLFQSLCSILVFI